MVNRLLNIAGFVVLSALWLAFGVALIFDRELLEMAWLTLRTWPLLVQLVAWLLALPVVLGLWIWQTPWPMLLRLVLVIGLGWVTVYTFFPWKPARRANTAMMVS
jgi:hypothetical protein